MPRRRDQELLREIGRRIAQARKGKGFTQESLAEAIGVEPVSLSRAETGDRAVSVSTLARLAEALHVGLGDLLDTTRPLPMPAQTPAEAELLRAFSTMSRSRRQVLLRLARELAS